MVGSALLVVGMTIVGLVSYIWKRKLKNQEMTKRSQRKNHDNEGGKNNVELPIFDLAEIANATNNFSINNKLGEGGFGPVYKCYMSPEYAVHGRYSVKSDVFSFGVLVLETMSGKKNRGFCHPDDDLNLLGHAWKLWIEDRPMELIDELVDDLCTPSDVLRHIHVGLLCVQQKPEDRPNMSFVVQMLSSKSLLPKPRQPGFFTDSPEVNPSSSKHTACSANGISITLLEAR